MQARVSGYYSVRPRNIHSTRREPRITGILRLPGIDGTSPLVLPSPVPAVGCVEDARLSKKEYRSRASYKIWIEALSPDTVEGSKSNPSLFSHEEVLLTFMRLVRDFHPQIRLYITLRRQTKIWSKFERSATPLAEVSGVKTMVKIGVPDQPNLRCVWSSLYTVCGWLQGLP